MNRTNNFKKASETAVKMLKDCGFEAFLIGGSVRDYIMGTIGIGNFVYVNQAEVARELRLDRAKVCHAIKRLISLGILICGPKSGRSNTYMVSPAFCFSGGLGHGIKERKSAIGRAKVTSFQDAIPKDLKS